MIEVRFHGRGGQGAKNASRILGQSGFLAGLQAQDFALFGAERRGAAVVAGTRMSDHAIDRRGYIDAPDLVMVLDASLLKEAAEPLFHGVDAATPMVVNSDPERPEPSPKELPPAQYVFIDLDRLARELIGAPLISAAVAAVAAKAIALITVEDLEAAVRNELADFGLAPELVERNVTAAREAYRRAPAITLASEKNKGTKEPSTQAVPYLGTAQFAGPTIRHRGSAALRQTGNWRSVRPEIDLAKCKRCFLCYLYCPEAALNLDSENFPHVDYDHCKGCMICYEECPTEAISRRVE